MIARLQAEIAVLRAENAELNAGWGMNSRNSSKPPSSDSPFVKPAPSLPRYPGTTPTRAQVIAAIDGAERPISASR
jgi:transposase